MLPIHLNKLMIHASIKEYSTIYTVTLSQFTYPPCNSLPRSLAPPLSFRHFRCVGGHISNCSRYTLLYIGIYIKGYFHRWFNSVYKFQNHKCDNYGDSISRDCLRFIECILLLITIIMMIELIDAAQKGAAGKR